jgi:8-oxo-dGTP pyrophosphatase MutT (NUDIX family)
VATPPGERHEELLNVYDEHGQVVGAERRRAAKASGRAVGAVNVLLVNSRAEVLLQRRPVDKENGGRWDKSVGGHVGAGEDFDATAVREASEELFDEPASPRVGLAAGRGELLERAAALDLSEHVLERFRPQRAEIDALRWAPFAEVDVLLLRGELAPNMAFLWLTHARPLLALIGR